MENDTPKDMLTAEERALFQKAADEAVRGMRFDTDAGMADLTRRALRQRARDERREAASATAGSRRWRTRIDWTLSVIGNQGLTGLVTLIGLMVAVTGVLIASLDWQGNVAERMPGSVAPPTSPTTSSAAPAEDLSYRLDAAAVDSHTVKVTAKASGEPEPGLTYWFVLEVNWGDGNFDYYPRRMLTAESATFEVPIPPDADPKYLRQGRVYGLNKAQSAEAEAKVEMQDTTKANDYFDNATGQEVSNATPLPYG